ncbi:hypothetical protein EMMF5_000601 [Cystobasidiomycetes sp. EMM_F5]
MDTCIRAPAQLRMLTTSLRAYVPIASTSTAVETAAHKFRPNRRDFDSLDARNAPDAEHHILTDRPSVAFTIRSPYSPAPPTLPAVVSSAAADTLPPRLRPEPGQHLARLSEEQMQELKSLRLSDPAKWTRSKLAKKYNVSPFFVSTLGFGDSKQARRVQKQVKSTHEREADDQRQRWGMKKTVDREVRRRRKQFW